MTIEMPLLLTPRLQLRTFTTADTDGIYDIFSSATVLRYWDSPPWSEKAQANSFIEKSMKVEEQPSGFRWAVEELATGALVGQCSVFNWNTTFKSLELGYCFREASWGQGLATEAAGAALQWAFESLEINRVQAEIDTRNIASGRVLSKLGFLHEGTLRENCIVNGEVSDTHVYGLLKCDWKHLSAEAAASIHGTK